MQRRCKHALPTIEGLFSVWSVQSGYKEEFNWEELVEFRDATLPGYEPGSGGIELSRACGIGSLGFSRGVLQRKRKNLHC
jgi:hypothetical protein